MYNRTARALCLTSVKNEDKHDFSKIVEAVKVYFLPSSMYIFVFLPVHRDSYVVALDNRKFLVFEMNLGHGKFKLCYFDIIGSLNIRIIDACSF